MGPRLSFASMLVVALASGFAEARTGPGAGARAAAGCEALAGCGECRSAGCFWQGAGGCRSACLIHNIDCFSPLSLDACPVGEKPNSSDLTTTADPEEGCGVHSSCGDCAGAGCAWTIDQCLDDCYVMDVSCFTNEAICPQDDAVCEAATGCGDCLEKGCVFQEGECRGECMFGPEGDFLAPCVWTDEACPEPTTAAAATTEEGCGIHSSCGDCAGAGCAWTIDQCLDDCYVMDVSCFTDEAICPQDDAVCEAATGCGDCLEKGCVFQEGECRGECMFGPLGDFLPPCVWTDETCPE